MADLNKDGQGYVKNRIFVHKGEQKTMLEQVVTFGSFKEEGANTLFSFWDDFKVEGKEETESLSILNIEKTNDGKYCVRIKKPEIFLGDGEKGLSEFIETKDGNDLILNIDSNQEAISLEKNGTELIVKVTATDGQAYTITAGATNISIQYGENSFIYQTNNERAISTNVDSSIIEEFFDSNKKVCKTPRAITSFPSYLIGLFEASLEKNKSVTYGQFTITKIDLAEDGKEPSPCLFVTRTYANGKKMNTVYINGKLQRCDNFHCQYQKTEEGKIIPSIVLEVQEKASKKTYFNLPLTVNENALSQTSQTVLELMSKIATNVAEGSEAVNLGNDQTAYNFFIQDSRDYAEGDFTKLRPARRIIQVKEEEFVEENSLAEQENLLNITPESAESEAKAKAEAEEQARIKAEKEAKAQAEAKEREEAEAKAKAEEQARLQQEKEKKAQEQAEAERKKQADDKAKDEARIKAEEVTEENKTSEDEEIVEEAIRAEKEEPAVKSKSEQRMVAIKELQAERQRKRAEVAKKKQEEEEAKLQQEQEEEEAWAQKQAELEKQKEKDAEKDKKSRQREVNLSKPVENLSQFATFGGLFMFAVSAITPIGALLAPIGLALGVGGIIGQNIAGELKFKYFKRAKYKLEEYEKQAIKEQVERDIAKATQIEQQDYIDSFLAQEQQVEIALEDAMEPEEKLRGVLEDSLGEFAEIYNEYGMGFSADLDYYENIGETEHTRSTLLSSFEGLEFRQQLLREFSAISSAKKVEQRQNLVSKFISTHFASLPQEKRDALESFFSRENQPQLKQLTEAMEKANESHAKVKELQDSQAKILASLGDYSLEKLISSEKMTAEGREQFFKSYSPALIHRISKEDNLGQVKLIKFVTAVPEKERASATKELERTAGRIDSKIQYAKSLAEKRDRYVSVVRDVENKAFQNVEKKIRAYAPQISSMNEIEKYVGPYLLTYDRQYHEAQTKSYKMSSFSSMLGYIYGKETDVAFIDNTIYEKWQAVYEHMKDNHFTEIAEYYASQEKGSPYPSPYDTFKTPRKHKTIVEMARVIADKQNDSDLRGLVSDFDKVYGEHAYIEGLDKIIKALSEKLSGVEAEEKAVKSLSNKIAGCEYTCKEKTKRKKLNGEIAEVTAKLDKRIKELDDKKDKISADEIKEIDVLKSARSFIDFVVLGKMSQFIKESSINDAIDAKCKEAGIKDNKTSTWAYHIKEHVKGKHVLDDILSTFSSRELREAITKKFEEKHKDSSKHVSSDLLEVVSQISLSEIGLSSNDFDAVFNEDSPLSQETYKSSEFVRDCDKRCAIELASMEHDLEGGLGEKIYEKQTRIKSGYREYKSLVELLADITGKDNDEILKIAHAKKYDIDKILKELKVSKNEYYSASKYSTFSEFAPKQELKAFDLRLEAEKLSTQIADEDMDSLDRRRISKRIADLEFEAQLSEKLAFASSEEEKEFLIAQFDIVKRDAEVLEFKTKYETILDLKDKKGYGEAFVAEALDAFARGDEQYFEDHPDIELPEPYFFSEDDVKLCKSLKIKKRKLKARASKRAKIKEKFDIEFQQAKKKKTEKVKQLKAKADSDKEKAEKKLTNAQLKSYTKKMGVLSAILSLFHKETVETAPENSEYKRVANAGYLYSGNEVERLSAEEKQSKAKAEDAEKSAE